MFNVKNPVEVEAHGARIGRHASVRLLRRFLMGRNITLPCRRVGCNGFSGPAAVYGRQPAVLCR